MAMRGMPPYIATVGADRTIRLPDDIPVGAQVAITVIAASEQARNTRFAATLTAARKAGERAAISDAEVNALVARARKAR